MKLLAYAFGSACIFTLGGCDNETASENQAPGISTLALDNCYVPSAEDLQLAASTPASEQIAWLALLGRQAPVLVSEQQPVQALTECLMRARAACTSLGKSYASMEVTLRQIAENNGQATVKCAVSGGGIA